MAKMPNIVICDISCFIIPSIENEVHIRRSVLAGYRVSPPVETLFETLFLFAHDLFLQVTIFSTVFLSAFIVLHTTLVYYVRELQLFSPKAVLVASLSFYPN